MGRNTTCSFKIKVIFLNFNNSIEVEEGENFEKGFEHYIYKS